MNLRYSAEDEAFRDEVASFVRDNIDPAVACKVRDNLPLTKEEHVGWERTIGARGWAAPHWPVEHGGTGWGALRRFICEEALASECAPRVNPCGVSLIAPVIIHFGNAAQKAHYLPRILMSEDWWCQGFSEPNAGSDLASLRTRAERHGDHFRLNGQKTWTTQAQHANLMFCLARTDNSGRKQEGISVLIVDMNAPGVSVRPIITIEGTHEVNEVFFDNVKVPIENLVGEEGRGWSYAKFMLEYERFGTPETGRSKQQLARLKDVAGDAGRGGASLRDDPDFTARLAWVEIELMALEATMLRFLAEDAGGKRSVATDAAIPMLKVRGTDIQQELSELFMLAAGPRGMAWHHGLDARCDRNADTRWMTSSASHYFNWRKASIYGGSSEIQRQITAKNMAGL
ncbi:MULTISPECIES: acyl-CoA dehydrogenase family protein [unclassified Chelatococcus]|uniref:acyl-CoA dehydrogenase family protein n=1 Tax=unclassified Chelatococcus TaxID=2638111 RepID=UPI001BCF9F06|nr:MULTISPECIES: acyl-CoA dehydrogenase family protein [unclassified Chelatococcus]CAH1655690.1 putative acyl-CoA dehydrogenase oxidoreductase, may be related to NAD-dependent histone acetylation [Hyphomicrobiales bacterium]MBS7742572.1 acyl-CoA dehydrogenase family protein [Chelatococcus sp. HY11]MBX3542310.1 acyl-CoA dehydrogenase family protein [Chelatococcus sp.]MCO5075472.1 acyl-CoA dehydrogenase family protein [Chelatococcus sp.]CAH1695603.1 putative acyl-CoA dehydrogenase oxidoreductase